jgi:hypothetical protein
MVCFPRFAFLIGSVTIAFACGSNANADWPFSDAAPTVLAPIAARVDRCLDSLRVPLVDANSKAIESCACPVTTRELECHAGNRFVAFAGSNLPTRSSWRPSRSGTSEYGLAYFPDGKPAWTEFSLHGFATLDPSPTRLGINWYLVGICGTCD